MPANTMLKRLLDAGMQFSEMSQSAAEKLVAELTQTGQVRRKDAEQTVQQLVDRGRASTEQFMSAVQAEVSKQLGRFADRIDDVEDRIEDLADQFGVKAKSKAATVSAPVAEKAPAKKAPAKKIADTSGVAKVATKKATKR